MGIFETVQKSINTNNVNLHVNYTDSSMGLMERDCIMFSHGFLMNNEMFAYQSRELSKHFRCVTYDQRGHGNSEIPQGGYTLDNYVNDAIGIIEAMKLEKVHFVGMSVGGMIGLRLAIKRPDLVKSLSLISTTAQAESRYAKIKYKMLLNAIRYLGWLLVIDEVMKVLFGNEFLKSEQNREEIEKWKNVITGHDTTAIIAFMQGILGRADILEQIEAIKVPTAIIVGDKDIATPIDMSLAMANKLPGSMRYIAEDLGHSAIVENPAKITSFLLDFYTQKGFIRELNAIVPFKDCGLY